MLNCKGLREVHRLSRAVLQTLEHENQRQAARLPSGNTNLDPRLKPNGLGQQLNLNATEINAVIAFLKTLSGTDVYTNRKWSNPFN